MAANRVLNWGYFLSNVQCDMPPVFRVHSSYICDMVAKLDYWGIAVLGLASAYPKISYKFACGRLVKANWIFVSIIIVLCAICMFLTLKPTIV